MTETAQTLDKRQKSMGMSVWIIFVMVIIALIAAWLMKDSVESRSQVVEYRDVKAMAPVGWKVTRGLAEGTMVFSVKDIFSPDHSYEVSLLPTSTEMTLKDVAFTHNLTRSGVLDSYRVLGQEPAQMMGKEAYQVHFAYVNAKDMTEAPTVIEGLDYIFLKGDKALIVTMEGEKEEYSAALADFERFVGSVTYNEGGAS